MGVLNFLGNVLLRCMPESEILFFVKEMKESIDEILYIDFRIVYRTINLYY